MHLSDIFGYMQVKIRSSRMYTACLETMHASVSVATNRCHSWGVSQNEQVWTGFQWSPPDVTSRGFPGLMSRGSGVPCLTFSGVGGVTLPHLSEGSTLPCGPSYEAFDAIPHEQTNACENITFPQTYLRAVMNGTIGQRCIFCTVDWL